MNTPYICLRCRQHIAKKTQQARGIGFVSLSRNIRANQDGIPPERVPNHEELGKVEKHERLRKSQERFTENSKSSLPRDFLLESLFVSKQQKQHASIQSRYSKLPIDSRSRETDSVNRLYLEQLNLAYYKHYPEGEASLQEVWSIWQKLVETEENRRASLHGGIYDKKLFQDILVSITRSQTENDGQGKLPEVHEIFRHQRLREIFPHWWNKASWIPLNKAVELVHKGTELSAQNPIIGHQLSNLVEGLVKAWTAVLEAYTPDANALQSEEVKDPKGSTYMFTSMTSFDAAFPDLCSLMFSQTRRNHLARAAAKITLQCIEDLKKISPQDIIWTADHQQSLRVLELIVKSWEVKTETTKAFLLRQGIPSKTVEYAFQSQISISSSNLLPSGAMYSLSKLQGVALLESNLNILELEKREKGFATKLQVLRNLCQMKGSNYGAKSGQTDLSGNVTARNNETDQRFFATTLRRLQQATEQYDVEKVARIWQDFQKRLADDGGLTQNSREEAFIHFLSSFVALKRQEQAVQVWNIMVQSNVTPNQRHWNAMLSGASKSHDVRSVQEIWANMVASGIEPDRVSWTTYIHGQIKYGRWQQGLESLQELGRIWKATAREKSLPYSQNTAEAQSHTIRTEYDPKVPSLAPVNAAISALSSIQRFDVCSSVISWATSHGLRATTETFNILLRPSVRKGDKSQTDSILSLMTKHNCSPDEFTYTILLNGLFDYTSAFSYQSSDAQLAAVFQLITEMRDRNLPVTNRTYSTILHGLLSPKTLHPNPLAARAILDDMSAHSIKPSTYDCHILISHYFSLRPANIPAIEALYKRTVIEHTPLDHEVFERLVEGYAREKEIERMFFYLRRMPAEGKSPRWRTLIVVLETLVEGKEWALVGELARDVADPKGLRRFAEDEVGGRLRGEFWAIVEAVKGRVGEARWGGE